MDLLLGEWSSNCDFQLSRCVEHQCGLEMAATALAVTEKPSLLTRKQEESTLF